MASKSRNKPEVLRTAEKVYKALLDAADDEGLWEGAISELVAEHGGRNAYARIMEILKESGAVAVVQRGSARWPSILKVTPSVDIEVPPSKTISKGDVHAALQEIRSVRESLGGLDVAKALADLQGEIDLLKEKAHVHD